MSLGRGRIAAAADSDPGGARRPFVAAGPHRQPRGRLTPIIAAALNHAMPYLMTDERLILAIGRLERALSRIEAKVTNGQPDQRLQARHDKLRDRLAHTVERIDRLLETQ